MYAKLRGEEFKKEFGIDWENNPDSANKFVTDDNGEPRLIAGNGHYLAIGVRGNKIIIPEVKNARSFAPVHHVKTEIVDTIVSWVNDVRRNNPELFKGEEGVSTVSTLFNPSEGSKGVLAGMVAVRAFTGIDNSDADVAEALYRIFKKEGFQAMKDAMPEGVGFAEVTDVNGTTIPVYQYFLNVYNEWEDVTNPITGNIISKGWRSDVKEALEAHGLKLIDTADESSMEEFTEDFVRVHDLSRLQEDPRKKMTEVVKGFLMDIRKEANIFGYETAYPLEHMYSLISEATVGHTTYKGMKDELAHRAKYKPEINKILERLDTLTAKQEAAFFSNFKMSYKSFLQFKVDKVTHNGAAGAETSFRVRMFNSNESDTAKKYRTFYKRQSRDYQGNNDRALYQVTVDEEGNETLLVPADKKARIEAAWKRVEKGTKVDSFKPLPIDAVEALGTLIWELGMQYGPTEADTIGNLKRYFEVGDTSGTSGVALFNKFVIASASKSKSASFKHLIKSVLEDKDIYADRGKAINVIASITPLFDSKSFGSFISGTGKQYYPINDPTTVDEVVASFKTDDLLSTVEDMHKDPLNSPGDRIENTSILLRAMGVTSVREAFAAETMDSFKGAFEGVASTDYGNQSKKISLIVRLNSFANNSNKDFTKIALPTQADRSRLDFITLPRVNRLSSMGIQMDTRKVLRGLVVQDLARMNEASKTIDAAALSGDTSLLIEGYHYNPRSASKLGKDGKAFTMTQVSGLKDSKTGMGAEGKGKLSGSMDMYLSPTFFDTEIFTTDGRQINALVEEQVDNLEKKLEVYEENIKAKIAEYGITLSQDVNATESIKPNFIKDFVLNDVVGKIELAKLFRGGFSFSKSPADYYKRSGLLNTPGKKLFLRGTSEKNADYGMMPKYGAITVKDFDFTDKEGANKVADTMRENLIKAGVSAQKAEELSLPYRSVNKTDSQGWISIDMYRGIMMGIGEWDTKLDGQAYRNEKAGKGFITDSGVARPIYPIKPYHEEMKMVGRVRAPVMDKNSYMTVTQEIASITPGMRILHDRLAKGDVQVINSEGATKGMRIDVQDVEALGTLEGASVSVYDSAKLRLPQIMPKTSQKELLLSVQVRKNITANLRLEGRYEGPWGYMSGATARQLFQTIVAENITDDLANLEGDLGLTDLRLEVAGTEEYAAKKLEHLKKLRDVLVPQIKDKDLPDNYIKALDIVPNGKYDYKFDIPLSFPNYQAKFEQIFFSQFKKKVFDQKIKGKELVQIAEAGGHEIDGDLKMYDGTSPAEVRIKASTLGLPAGTDINSVDPALLRSVGYRVPNQGKNSMLPILVVGFLPESHEKAIMVPGGITLQMGADFDVDKMSIMQAETTVVDGIITKVRPDYNKHMSKQTRAERNTILYDLMESIMMSPHHLEEVITPLDSPRLKNLATEIKNAKLTDSSIDYNDPMAEVEMEARNKAGVAGRGLWANQLAGRNAAQLGNLTVATKYTPKFVYQGEVVEFSEIAVAREFVEGEGFTGSYTDYNISMYLSAAVDAANDPIQIDINDNLYTIPVAGMMLSMGVPVKDIVYFLSQPAIIEAVEYAQINEFSVGQFTRAIDAVAAARGGNAFIRKDSTTAMVPSDLREFVKPITEENKAYFKSSQLAYLDNFKAFYLAGRSLKTISTLITPGNIKNVNEISAINAHLEVEERHLGKVSTPIIMGAEELIRKGEKGERTLAPMATAFRGLLDSMLTAAADSGFVNNSEAFKGFKTKFKALTNTYNLNAEHHKFIDRSLFTKLMLSEGSPFMSGVGETAIAYMYTNPAKNIDRKLQEMQLKYPMLRNSPLLNALEAGADNSNKADQKVFTVKFDNSFDLSAADKNAMSASLMQMLSTPEKFLLEMEDKEARQAARSEIRNFAKTIVYNQLLTTGFRPGGYADMIPSEVFTTKILFDDKSLQTPVEFFREITEQMYNPAFFDDFMHDFIANFGVAAPGGIPILPKISYKSLSKTDAKGVITVKGGKKSRVYDKNFGYAAYFTTKTPAGDTKVFVRHGDAEYVELQRQGAHPVHEVGVQQNKSIFNSEGVVASPGLNETEADFIGEIPMPSSIEQPQENCN